MRRLRAMGPGLLVTAAFIGPGTVTTATLAGAKFGFALVWAVAFSTLATIVLQEMSARLGLVARMGPAEALRVSIRRRPLRMAALALVVLAIAFGNAAFQAGNITGTAIGLEAASGIPARFWAIGTGLAAGGMLALGRYRWIERVLIALVVLMSAAFVATAVIAGANATAALRGLVPRIPMDSEITIIALIGTTVVPYNLFLHASAVQAKWPATAPLDESLTQARFDAGMSIGLGGLVTAAILVTSASFFQIGAPIDSASVMAEQLSPLLGPSAKYLFLAGLTAAGLTSAITAPLAAAYATAGALGWPADLKNWRFRAVWSAVVIAGTLFAALGRNPIEAIRWAQAFNGLLLPMVAAFLMYAMNQPRILGGRVNGPLANTLGAVVVLTTAGVGILHMGRAFGWY